MSISQSVNQDALGSQTVAGEGIAGTPSGGVLSVQGVTSGTPVRVALDDGVGNSIVSYNSQIAAVDIINTSISSGSITVSTSAVAARVSTANLANRKMLMIAPITGIVYLGSSSAVTTATGIPIYPNTVVSFSFSTNVTPFLIAAASITVNVFEGA